MADASLKSLEDELDKVPPPSIALPWHPIGPLSFNPASFRRRRRTYGAGTNCDGHSDVPFPGPRPLYTPRAASCPGRDAMLPVAPVAFKLSAGGSRVAGLASPLGATTPAWVTDAGLTEAPTTCHPLHPSAPLARSSAGYTHRLVLPSHPQHDANPGPALLVRKARELWL